LHGLPQFRSVRAVTYDQHKRIDKPIRVAFNRCEQEVLPLVLKVNPANMGANKLSALRQGKQAARRVAGECGIAELVVDAVLQNRSRCCRRQFYQFAA